jgi:hypothetical protein
VAPATPVKPALAVSTQQFDRAVEVAKLAAEQKMLALSLRAVRDALSGGPPMTINANFGRNRRSMMVVGSQTTDTNDNSGQHNQVVANRLNELVALWRREGVAETDIYDTLVDGVLPEARPAEVFLYVPATLDDPSQPGASVGRLLAEAALRSKRLDDLHRRIAARQDKPLGEWNARLLLAQVAWVAKDDARLRELLKEFAQRLQKDTLRHTAALVCQVTAPVLERKELAPAALPVLERAVKNLAAAGGEQPAMNMLLFLARHDFQHGKIKEGKARLKEVTGMSLKSLVRGGGQSPLIWKMQDVTQEYIRAGLLDDTLELFAMAVDLPPEQRSQIPRDVLSNLIAAFARQLVARPAAERYELLKNWTLPTPQRRSVRILGAFVSTETPPTEFSAFPRSAWTRGDAAGGVLSTTSLLIEAAQEAGKLNELAAEARSLVKRKDQTLKIENADVLYAIVQITRGQGATVEDIVKQHLDQLKKKIAAPPPIRSPYYGGPQQQGLQVEWPDYLLVRAGLSEPRLVEASRAFADQLLSLAQRTQNQAAQVHLREDLAQSRYRRAGGVSPLLPREQGAYAPRSPELQLPHWHPGGYVSAGARHNGILPASWVAHEGHVAHLFGPDHEFLIHDYPLTGTFEFSVDTYHGGWAEGHFGYAGMVFEPNPSSTSAFWPVGSHERINLPSGAIHRDSFNRFTVQVTPGKLRWLVNGRLVHEQADPSPTSPWLALYAGHVRHTVFRNPQLVGSPQIPRQVHLTHGDRLEGWVSSFYGESQPRRLNKQEQADASEDDAEDRLGEGTVQQQQPSSFDWYAHDGEIHGRHNRDHSGRWDVGSLLAYFRPLRPGETVSYEFFYRPDEVMVHPSLGRLVFLMGPEGVRLHWLAENDGNDWTGLTPDNTVEIPGAVSLKTNEWNRLQLSLTADSVKIEVNGAPVCQRKLEASEARTFGLFHYKNRTAAQVRNVVLTGDWPEKLSEKEMADSFLVSDGGDKPHRSPDGAVLRTLIGDTFFLKGAGSILKQARALPPEQAYELLRAWVLPNDDHALFQMASEFTPTDPAPPLAPKPLPIGRRVQTGGDLEAPALELVLLAKKLGKLDELVQSVQKASTPGQARGRLAMLALLQAAQGRDNEAAKALGELAAGIAPLPVNEPIWQRWPELVAAVGTMNRPTLLPSALALLDAQVRRVEQPLPPNTSLPDHDPWTRHVRQTRAVAQVLSLPEKLRVPFGTDPNLRYWDPVAHNRAHPRGINAPKTHWAAENGAVMHYPGRAQDYLYLRTPLQGDFEVSCDLTSFGWREAHVGYGGIRFDLMYTLKRYNLSHFTGQIRSGDIQPPLKQPGQWYKFRLVIHGDTYTAYVNDRKLCEEPLPDDADPWLMLHADKACTAGIRNLRITGQPRVPESLSLSSLPDLSGWISYDDSAWQKRGDTIVGQGSRPNPNAEKPPPRTWQERALHYHRPLLEDGELEYDFFYEPGKTHGHPALDRLVFLLDPEGVRIHWLTDGIHDRTGLSPDNATTETKSRRGPTPLPLKAKAWNHLKLSLSGDTVTLHLNGVAIYERALESTNQRTFGLFHYADETTFRVRNVIYRGQWPRRLPDAGELWATQAASQ